jgi:hypothetical protein
MLASSSFSSSTRAQLQRGENAARRHGERERVEREGRMKSDWLPFFFSLRSFSALKMEGALVALVALAPFPYPHSLSPPAFFFLVKKEEAPPPAFFPFRNKEQLALQRSGSSSCGRQAAPQPPTAAAGLRRCRQERRRRRRRRRPRAGAARDAFASLLLSLLRIPVRASTCRAPFSADFVPEKQPRLRRNASCFSFPLVSSIDNSVPPLLLLTLFFFFFTRFHSNSKHIQQTCP